MSDVEIPIGMGKVKVRKNISAAASRGKFVVLRTTSRAGPCNDNMCQVIRGVRISIELPEDDDNLSVFAGGGFFVAMDKEIARSIDKGRQEVTVGMGISGKPYVKGLNYAD